MAEKLTREELCRYNDPDGEPCRLPAVAKYREKNVCVWHRSIFIDGKTAPPPEPERPEWWGEELTGTKYDEVFNWGDGERGLHSFNATYPPNLLALRRSHNARLDAEALVRELEAREQEMKESFQKERADFWESYRSAKELKESRRRLAAEAELRRLRKEVKKVADCPLSIGTVLMQSESRYPLPAEGEHRGSRR